MGRLSLEKGATVKVRCLIAHCRSAAQPYNHCEKLDNKSVIIFRLPVIILSMCNIALKHWMVVEQFKTATVGTLPVLSPAHRPSILCAYSSVDGSRVHNVGISCGKYTDAAQTTPSLLPHHRLY